MGFSLFVFLLFVFCFASFFKFYWLGCPFFTYFAAFSSLLGTPTPTQPYD
jgi:hypothetical protein